MSVREDQHKHSLRVAHLILRAEELGYEITGGDWYRDPRVFGEWGTHRGYGYFKSRHKQRLATDFNLFKDGKYLTATEDYTSLGEFWESLGGIWGGRFKTNPDGNHFQS